MKLNSIILILLFSSSLLSSQNIGIEISNPQSKLHLGQGDIFLDNHTQGVIMKSPNGNCWKQTISNTGTPVFTLIACPGVPSSITYGGQTYAIKPMPDGKWWMAENLNIGTMITGATDMTNNSVIEKYCYADNAANCTTYGGLYQWNEMMQYTTAAGAQGICPTGWHVPTDAEWTALETALPSPDKGSRLAGNAGLWIGGALDQSQYFGTSGFAALPTGYRYTDGSFFNQSDYAVFWSSTENGGSNAWFRYLFYSNTDVTQDYTNKPNGFSVRCVQD